MIQPDVRRFTAGQGEGPGEFEIIPPSAQRSPVAQRFNPNHDELGRFSEGDGDAVYYPGVPKYDIQPDKNVSPDEGWGLKIDPKAREAQLLAMGDNGVKGEPPLYSSEGALYQSWEYWSIKGEMDKARQSMESNWTGSPSNPNSALIQTSLGDTGRMIWSQGQPTLEPSAASRAAAEYVYARTQATLLSGPESTDYSDAYASAPSLLEVHGEPGSQTVTLYRGLKDEYASHNVLESWSTSEQFAGRFDGFAILRAEVPLKAIFMDLRSHTQYEAEMVVRTKLLPDGVIRVLPGNNLPPEKQVGHT